MKIEEEIYDRHKYVLSRRYYNNLPEKLVPKIGDLVLEANSSDLEEFEVIEFNGEEVKCFDISKHIFRWFYIDSIRVHPKQIKRIKNAKILDRKTEAKRKRQEKEQKRVARTFEKLKREEDKRNRKFKREKLRELKIKFV